MSVMLVRQERQVERPPRRHLQLEGGPAPQKPAREAGPVAGIAQEPEQALDERVGPDQGAVEVDANGARRS